MFIRFLFVGGLGFVVDASVTALLVWLGTAAWMARIPAIGSAMVFTWVANRTFTYNSKATPTPREAIHYALVAAAMACLNYLIYLALLSIELSAIAAITIATAVQTGVSFSAYRKLVFRKTP